MASARTNLTFPDLTILGNAIRAETDPVIVEYMSHEIPFYHDIADWYNEAGTVIVWKTYLEESVIVSETSAENTTWDWTAYINTNVAEKMAWERIFNGTFSIDPSLENIRLGIADIFSGPQGADQRQHLLAVAKRPASKVEELFTTGTGTTATPEQLVFEGDVSWREVRKALDLAAA